MKQSTPAASSFHQEIPGGFSISAFLPAYVGFALLAAFAFAVRAVLARGGAAHLSLPHTLVLQSALSLPLLATIARLKNSSLAPNLQHKKTYLWRMGSSVAYTLLLLYSLMLMPAVLASALSYTAPLFTALLAPRILRESTTRPIIAVTVVGFLGLGITAEPYLGNVSMFGIGVGVLCGLAGAFLQMSMRKLASVGESGLRGVFWTHAAGLVIGVAGCILSGNLDFTTAELAVGLFIAFAQVIGQLANSSAYASGRALPVNAISFVTLPLTLVLAVIILDETVSVLAVAGLFLTLPACFGLVWLEQAHLKQLHNAKAVLTPADIQEEHAQVEEGALGLGNEPLIVTEPRTDELFRMAQSHDTPATPPLAVRRAAQDGVVLP